MRCCNDIVSLITGVVSSELRLRFPSFDCYPKCGHRREQLKALFPVEVLGQFLVYGSRGVMPWECPTHT